MDLASPRGSRYYLGHLKEATEQRARPSATRRLIDAPERRRLLSGTGEAGEWGEWGE